MLELFAKIILIGSILGMGTIAVQKIPVLRNLPIEKEELKEKRKISWSLISKTIERRIKISLSFLKNQFLNLKKFKRDSKGKENKFSDDYWNKIRNG